MTSTAHLRRAGRIALTGLLVLPQAVAPAAITVEGACTLPDAITAANLDRRTGACPPGSGADTIALTADVELTVADNPDNGLPQISSKIKIQGNGFSIERSPAAPAFRILDVLPSGDLTLEEVTIANGDLAAKGAGIRTFGALALENSTVTRNESRNRGGGIYANGVEVTLVNSTVTNNTARRGAGITAYDYSSLTVSDSAISDNVAASRGGGVLLVGSPAAISNSTISSNSASSGGGIRATGYSYLEIFDTTVSNNKSSKFEGGGIFASYSGPTLVRSRVTGNSASRGGGIFATPGYGDASVQYSTISGNSATEAGGGIFFSGYPDAALRLTNTTVSGNSAETGGGIYQLSGYYRDSSLISYSTIAQNTASTGAGIFAMNEYAEYHFLRGSLVAGNVGGNCGGPGLTDEGTNFDDDGSCPGASAIVPGTDFDTELADNGGPTPTHALLEGSVAIDAGGDCFLESDQRGFGREGPCDSGSFEFDAAGPLGGSVRGVGNRKVLCKNLTTGQKGKTRTSEHSWLCNDLGVTANSSDRVRLSSTGVANGAVPVGGSVTGLDLTRKPRVLCRNRTSGQKVSFASLTQSWDCEAQGLSVEPGDSILQKFRGTVR